MRKKDPLAGRIYISVPMTGRPLSEIRAHADRLAQRCQDLGFEPHDPTRTPDFRSCSRCVDYRLTILHDLRDLRACRHLFLALGWEHSLGCVIELSAFLAWKQYRPSFGGRVIYEGNEGNEEFFSPKEMKRLPRLSWEWLARSNSVLGAPPAPRPSGAKPRVRARRQSCGKKS